tara:strand:+ start:722 stop:826 length:105 start_codon:yes stop_codon:yes gene_type:complete
MKFLVILDGYTKEKIALDKKRQKKSNPSGLRSMT